MNLNEEAEDWLKNFQDISRIFGFPIVQTRCIHYDSPLDVVAIKFKCCGQYFPCHRCHDEAADHPTERWSRAEFDQPAVLCGACGHELTIRAYLDADEGCPHCHAPFNPSCRDHRRHYVEA